MFLIRNPMFLSQLLKEYQEQAVRNLEKLSLPRDPTLLPLDLKQFKQF